MKKRKTNDKLDVLEEKPKQNPVAKFAARFNKAKVIDDKSAYKRKKKYVEQDSSFPSKSEANRED